jgi:hypothetical protein
MACEAGRVGYDRGRAVAAMAVTGRAGKRERPRMISGLPATEGTHV